MKTFLTCLITLITLQVMSQDLFDAYKQKNLQQVEAILKNGADPDQLNKSGVTLMYIAAGDNSRSRENTYKIWRACRLACEK